MIVSYEFASGGLSADHDLFFASCPEDPEMRESTSFWLYDESGRFALPRLGIERLRHDRAVEP